MEKTVLEYIKSKNLMISTIESMTGGGIINCLTNIAGFSDVIYGGIIIYSNKAKHNLFGKSDMNVYSEEYTEYLCKEGFNKMDTNIIISISGNINKNIDTKLSYSCHVSFGFKIDNNIIIETKYYSDEDNVLDSIIDQTIRREKINNIVIAKIMEDLMVHLKNKY